MELRRSSLRRQRRKQVVHDFASAVDTVFCRHEPAYLCVNCGFRENQSSQAATSHEDVLVCAACERAPAVVTCLADAAALCAVCDSEIHSASSVARRHHRTPIVPLPLLGGSEKTCINPVVNDVSKDDAFFPGEEVDQYLDLTELDDLETELQPMGSERVVPFNCAMAEEQEQQQQQKHHFDASTVSPLFGYNASINNSASVSSMEASTVPDDDAAMNDPKMGLSSTKLLAGCHQPQISPLDRKARVLRYMEKKKARNFEKTIRYASRKAYAEARPRIRGRFATRSDVETDAGKKLSGPSSAASEGGYGIVPSFS